MGDNWMTTGEQMVDSRGTVGTVGGKLGDTWETNIVTTDKPWPRHIVL